MLLVAYIAPEFKEGLVFSALYITATLVNPIKNPFLSAPYLVILEDVIQFYWGRNDINSLIQL